MAAADDSLYLLANTGLATSPRTESSSYFEANTGLATLLRAESSSYFDANTLKRPLPGKTTYTDSVKRDLPLAYWELEEAAGATSFRDSLNGHLLDAVGSPTSGQPGGLTDPASRCVSALSAANHLRWTAPPTLTAPYTVECLFQRTSASGFHAIVASRGPNEFGFQLLYDASNGRFVVDIGSATLWLYNGTVTAVVSPDAWYHVALVVTTTSWTLYLDGAQIGTGALSGTAVALDSNHRLFVGYNGTHGNTGGYGFPGSIDEVAIYDKALTSTRFLVRNDVAANAAEQVQLGGFHGWGIPL